MWEIVFTLKSALQGMGKQQYSTLGTNMLLSNLIRTKDSQQLCWHTKNKN